MALDTNIHWTDSTVNPTAGCDGCELWSLKEKPQDFENADQATKDRRCCYAGIMHDYRGGKIAGYAPTFKEVTPFPSRMAKSARWSNFTGLRRLAKPWLDGLPRLIFVSDLSDALSKSVSFDYLWMEIIQTALSGLRCRACVLTQLLNLPQHRFRQLNKGEDLHGLFDLFRGHIT